MNHRCPCTVLNIGGIDFAQYAEKDLQVDLAGVKQESIVNKGAQHLRMYYHYYIMYVSFVS